MHTNTHAYVYIFIYILPAPQTRGETCPNQHHQDSEVVSRLPLACTMCCSMLQSVAMRCSQHRQDSRVVFRFILASMTERWGAEVEYHFQEI